MKKILSILFVVGSYTHPLSQSQITGASSAKTKADLNKICQMNTLQIQGLERVNSVVANFENNFGCLPFDACTFMNHPASTALLNGLNDPAKYDVTTPQGAIDFLEDYIKIARRHGPIKLVNAQRLKTARQTAETAATKHRSVAINNRLQTEITNKTKRVINVHNNFGKTLKDLISRLITHTKNGRTDTDNHATGTAKAPHKIFTLFGRSIDTTTGTGVQDNMSYPCDVSIPISSTAYTIVRDPNQKEIIAKALADPLRNMLEQYTHTAKSLTQLRSAAGLTKTTQPITTLSGDKTSTGAPLVHVQPTPKIDAFVQTI